MIPSALLSDNMVLQCDSTVKIWGESSPNTNVRVLFQGKEYNGTAGNDGKWIIEISDLPAGGPFDMVISSGFHEKRIKNILVGEVWLLSGQSNIELPIIRVRDLYEKEIENDYDNEIRTFIMERNPVFDHLQDEQTTGKWMPITPETVNDFSAVGYFFAKHLRKTHNVPIGLIVNAVGGSPIEAWMAEDTLLKLNGELKGKIQSCIKENYRETILEENLRIKDSWYKNLDKTDQGLAGKFYLPEYDDSSWSSAELPNSFEDIDGGRLKDIRGTIWLRKEFYIPSDVSLENAKLVLGTLVDDDQTYVNGVLIGEIDYRYPPRRYPIPGGILKHGKNLIAVRLISTANTYSFIVEKPYKLILRDTEIPLHGIWKYTIGTITEKHPETHTVEYDETGLYKGMVYPLRHFTIRGILFYQGESNTTRPLQYENLFRAMINDFRNLFGADMPFLYVQLPNFGEYYKYSTKANWAVLREAQRRCLDIPNTGMAITIDVGEWNDLHPLNKKDVGIRLALLARNLIFKENIVFSGPLYESKKCYPDRIEISFQYNDSELISKDGELKTFEIRSKDSEFVPAHARIEGEKIIVWADHVTNPTEVRYAWRNQPTGANLYNAEGLPASPFTTEELLY